MTPSIAQTNLQLLAQLIELGFDADALALANRAYFFAARVTCDTLRGSGKPFACHLVGSASVVAAAGEDAACVAASLLHAVYQDRVPFPGGRSFDARREYVRERFGQRVETLVHDYHRFEVVRLDCQSDEDLRRQRTVVAMRLADEIDDLVDLGIAMHGLPGDDAGVPGCAANRRAKKAQLAPDLLRAARAIDAPALESLLLHWLERTAVAPWPECLRSGEYSSFEATMPSD